MIRWLLLLLALGCDLFPADLYRQDGALPDATDRPEVSTVDECGGEVPALEQEVVNAPIDLSDDTNGDDGARCGLTTPGNDAYFAIPMAAGEKWHVHVQARPSLGFDPAIAVLDGCAGECVAAMDHCRTDQDEHLSFVAPADGIYVVRLDGHLEGGGLYDLLVAQPVCGDGGAPEHSETCDDGNTESGDGCDSRCRAELGSGDGEIEPNDDLTGANVLVAGSTVHGRIGGRCDQDYFVMAHGGGPLVAVLGGRDDGPCAAPSASLELVDSSGTLLASGAPEGTLCARLEHSAPASELYLRVDADPTAPDFEYEVSAE